MVVEAVGRPSAMAFTERRPAPLKFRPVESASPAAFPSFAQPGGTSIRSSLSSASFVQRILDSPCRVRSDVGVGRGRSRGNITRLCEGGSNTPRSRQSRGRRRRKHADRRAAGRRYEARRRSSPELEVDDRLQLEHRVKSSARSDSIPRIPAASARARRSVAGNNSGSPRVCRGRVGRADTANGIPGVAFRR